MGSKLGNLDRAYLDTFLTNPPLRPLSLLLRFEVRRSDTMSRDEL